VPTVTKGWSLSPGEKKRIRVDHHFLSEAMEDQLNGIENERVLDTKTGEVLHFSSEELQAAEEEKASDEDYPEWQQDMIERARAFLNEPDKSRYISIEPISPRAAHDHMREFSDSVEDRKFQSILYKSLSGDRPFRRFKDALEYDGDERERWFKFKDKKMCGVMEGWLEGLDLEGVEFYIEPVCPERVNG